MLSRCDDRKADIIDLHPALLQGRAGTQPLAYVCVCVCTCVCENDEAAEKNVADHISSLIVGWWNPAVNNVLVLLRFLLRKELVI